MQFALVHHLRAPAEPGLKGICAHCQSQVIAKCGTKKVWHWAHVAKSCDPWYEPETEWHRSWKSRFGPEFSEIRISKGENYHIADVYKNRIVFEFQNSSISSEEIRARETFYGERMLWIVNGEKFKNNFEFYDDHYKRSLRIDILNEFDAASRYNKPPAHLVVEADVVQSETQVHILNANGFILEQPTNIYCRSGSYSDRESLSSSIKQQLLQAHNKTLDHGISVEGDFYWKPARPSWEAGERALFLDFGDLFLYRITTGLGKSSGRATRIPKQKFLEKYC